MWNVFTEERWYAEYTFGKAGNFLCGYSYGISIIIANVVITTSAVGYGATFLGAELTPGMTCMATIAVLWIANLPNFGGPKVTGKLSSITVWGDSSYPGYVNRRLVLFFR